MTKTPSPFSAQDFLRLTGESTTVMNCRPGDTIYTAGEVGTTVLYIFTGKVKVSVRSATNLEAIVAILGPRHFLGEECLVGQRCRARSATALKSSTILAIDKGRMRTLLHTEHGLASRFLSHMLSRHRTMEEALVEQLVGQ